jgi:ABC-2 type transport system permease protein
VGKLAPYLLSGLVSVFLCIALIVYWFDVPFRSNLLILLPLSADFLLAVIGIGIVMMMTER